MIIENPKQYVGKIVEIQSSTVHAKNAVYHVNVADASPEDIGGTYMLISVNGVLVPHYIKPKEAYFGRFIVSMMQSIKIIDNF